MIIRERRRWGKRILVADAEGARAIACDFIESSSHAPFTIVELPAGMAFDAVEMIVSEPAKAKPRHIPIEGSQLGNPAEEYPTGKGQ